MSLLLSYTVTLSTFGAALEKTEMPKLVRVHKMSKQPNTPTVPEQLGGNKKSRITPFAVTVSSAALDQAACLDTCGRLTWATRRGQ